MASLLPTAQKKTGFWNVILHHNNIRCPYELYLPEKAYKLSASTFPDMELKKSLLRDL